MVTVTSARLYANLTAGWTDITGDAIGAVSFFWGISGTSPADRLADTGTMQFTLLDQDGHYSAGESTALAGWKKGCPVRLVVVYDGDSYTRFYGTLESITLEKEPAGFLVANCTAVDWMDYAAEHPILTPPFQTNMTADQGTQLVIAHMPIKPVITSYESGVTAFPSLFDVTRKKSKALTEFSSLVNSELGYLYLQKEKTWGEKLVFENAQHRNGLLPLSTIPLSTTDKLLMETGSYLLLETSDKILLNKTTTYTFSSTFTNLEIVYGENIANRIVMSAYPRKIDTSLVVLYKLGQPMQIGNGQTITWNGSYSDPNGGARAGGYNMVTPVATTDYTVNTLANGTGTDLTSSATVTVTFGGNSASITVTNTSTSSGYITLFQLRGYGIYTYADVTLELEDADAINTYGYYERRIDQSYQGSLEDSEGPAKTMLFLDRYPRNVVRGMTFIANKSDSMMASFLALDVGSLIKISESLIGISGAYIIQSVSATIDLNNIITVTYGLVEHLSLLGASMTSIKADFGAAKDALNYGFLPQTIQVATRSYAFWFYFDNAANLGAALAAPFSDSGGIVIIVNTLATKLTIYDNLFNTDPGQWSTAVGTISANTLTHVVVTFNVWSTANDPVIYINGVSKAVTEDFTPSGTLNNEYGAEVVIGNWHTITKDYGYNFYGYLQDVRIYNRILTSAEVTTLYNAGTPDASLVTTGLVFQGPTCPKHDQANYDNGAVLNANLKTLDNIYRAVGTPSGAPTADLW